VLGDYFSVALENSSKGVLSPLFITEMTIQKPVSFGSIFVVAGAVYPLTSRAAGWQEAAYCLQFAWQRKKWRKIQSAADG